MSEALLVLNAGSSSVKFQLFAYDHLDLLAKGQVVHIGGYPQVEVTTLSTGETFKEDLKPQATHEEAIASLVAFVQAHDSDWQIRAVAHRIVHGGEKYVTSVKLSPLIVADLQSLSPLAPLHQPHNLAAIGMVSTVLGEVAQVGCFDTAFHAAHTPLFTSFAIGADLRAQGVRRYGFHGLSYQWIAHVVAQDYPELANKSVVVAHLGNGASLCAMKGGQSIDTTMSMTPLDGLPMGTRSGAIDAGAIIYMLRNLGLSVDALEYALYDNAGLKGLSGISNDVEALIHSPDPAAAFALDYFALKAAQYTAMMAVSLGGIDAVIFTGGIGENAQSIREAIMARLGVLGNIRTLVIPANEERLMAMETKKVLDL